MFSCINCYELLVFHPNKSFSPIDPNKSATMENKVLSPLHYACWFNAAEAVDTLLDNNANVESCAAFGQKPLHYAATRASVQLVKVKIISFIRPCIVPYCVVVPMG